MPLTNDRIPYWFGGYWALSEVFDSEKGGVDWDTVVDKVVQRFVTIDGIPPDKTNILKNMINLTFDDGDIFSDMNMIISRYKIWKGKLTALNKNYIVTQLYDGTKEFWMKTQFFNASMNWDSLNNLLSKDTKRDYSNNRDFMNKWNGNETVSGKGTGDATGTDDTTNNQTRAEYDAAGSRESGDPLEVRKAEYLAGGEGSNAETKVTSETNNSYTDDTTSEATRTTDFSGTNDGTWSETVQQVKFEYLEKVYNFIDENKYLTQLYISGFVNSLIMPLQNQETDTFPWPWMFGNRRLY